MEGFSTAPQLSSAPIVTTIVAGTNVTIAPTEGIGSVTINAPGGGPGGGVLTLAGLEGIVTLSSPGGSITIATNDQDIELTANAVLAVAAGTGVSVSTTSGTATIDNTGVLSVSDGTTTSTGSIVLSGSDGVSVVNTAGTFAITNTGVTELTGGDGIGIDVQTGSVTISNLGLLSASAGDAGIGAVTTSGALSITNKGVRTLADLSGAILLTGGSGIGIATDIPTNGITISNTGLASASAGAGIFISTSSGVATISNIGVRTLNDLSGAVLISAGDGLQVDNNSGVGPLTISNTGVVSVNAQTGLVLIEAGDGISVTNSETPSVQIANTGVLSVSAGTGMSTETTSGVATLTSISRTYTLLGATTGGVITYSKASGSGNTWATNSWLLANTIQINVPSGWVAGESVGFDGYEYLNWDSNATSYFAIYYVTPSQPTEQSIIGTTTPGSTDAIYGGNGGQAYLPMNLTIPPTYLVSGSTITLRIYGLITSVGHYLVANPTIDARVNIVYP